MELRRKKVLPSGWTYLLTEKDLKAIDKLLDGCIISVHYDGTSYFERESSSRSAKTKLAAVRVISDIIDSNLHFHIFVDGIRVSNFTDNHEIDSKKQKLQVDLIKLISDTKMKFRSNALQKGLKMHPIFLDVKRTA